MIRTLVTVFAGLLGLAFGSFLNVCLSRWPEGESIVRPRSHCRNCGHTLAWWENIPLVSWIVLRGRCRECKTWIGSRYLIVELSLGTLWACAAWDVLRPVPIEAFTSSFIEIAAIYALSRFVLYWLLLALAFLDAENLWLPNFLTLPGIVFGLLAFGSYLFVNGNLVLDFYGAKGIRAQMWIRLGTQRLLAIIVCAGVFLLIRWLYWIFRHREGMGLGDVKLIAMLAAWLGLSATLLAFFISALLGAIAGLIVIAIPSKRDDGEGWATTKLPFGTFLCIGGIISSLWGQRIIADYLRVIGF
jgi:leader peptidase (prepilin peptidase)/N-methyltransferase